MDTTITRKDKTMVIKYKYDLIEQEKIDGRFKIIRYIFQNVDKDEENLRLSTSRDTMKWFRNIGSKQHIKREYKNGKEIIKIYSYNPHNVNHRNVHIFKEV